MTQLHRTSLSPFRCLFALAALALLSLLPLASAADDTTRQTGWMEPPPRPHVASGDSDDQWGARRVFAHFRTRAGIIQLCMAFMALGLFILMKKFAPEPSGECRVASGENADPASLTMHRSPLTPHHSQE
jgi:hypothetical protein